MSVNETKKLNLSSQEYLDFKIEVVSITGIYARIKFMEINETNPDYVKKEYEERIYSIHEDEKDLVEQEELDKEYGYKKKFPLIEATVLAIFFVFLLITFIYLFKRKKIEENTKGKRIKKMLKETKKKKSKK